MNILCILICSAIVGMAHAMRLHQRNIHLAVSSIVLQGQIAAAVNNLTQLNSSLNLVMSSLNPYNQQQRITSMEKAITSARGQLFTMYQGAQIPLNNSNYYCQQMTPQQTANLTTAIGNMQTELTNMNGIPPFSNSLHPYQQTSAQMSAVLASMKGVANQTGIVTAGAPIAVQQSNLAGGTNWALGNTTPTGVASGYVVGAFQNGKICPVGQPFVSPANACMACPGGYYDIAAKSCLPCANFNVASQVCSPVVPTNTTPTTPTTIPVNPTTPSNTSIPTTNVTNSTTTPAAPHVVPVTPIQYMTNTANPSSLLLPPNTTLAAFQAQQAKTNANLIACPSAAPYFDGTGCISCAPGQLFSVTTKTCQTCPTNTLYSSATFSCMPIVYYTNITASPIYLSITKSQAQLQSAMATAAALPNSQPCPLSTPFFNNSTCIGCPAATPYFSFDSNTCANCSAGTSFSSSLHSCVIIQQRQTGLSSPNLILGGLSFNEWNYFYVNNQTANPQLSNCPTAKPYFGGNTCIACSGTTPYFSLTHRVCVNCAAGTTYNPTVRECLGTSGNIVTQNPTLVKMAAGIFA